MLLRLPHEYNYVVSNYNYLGDLEKSLYDLGGLTSLSLNCLSIFLDSVKSFNLIFVKNSNLIIILLDYNFFTKYEFIYLVP